MRAKLEYRQLPPDIRAEAKIYRVTALQSDASESGDLSVASGRTLRLHGRNLSFDIADTAQGVFLENEGGGFRKGAAFFCMGKPMMGFRHSPVMSLCDFPPILDDCR